MIRKYQEEEIEGQHMYGYSAKRLKCSPLETHDSTPSSNIINFPLEMIDLIYSFIDEHSFLPALCKLLATCKSMNGWTQEKELFQMVLNRRTILVQSEGSFNFLFKLSKTISEKSLNSQIVLKVEKINNKMITLLEKFHTVEFNSCKLDMRTLYSVLNRTTSRIVNLIISNCKFDSMEVKIHRDISMNLKSIKCIDTSDMVLEGMPINNIEELEIEGDSPAKIEFPKSLKKLRLRKAVNCKTFPPELKKLSVTSWCSLSGKEIAPLQCRTLDLTECPSSSRELMKKFENVTKLIARQVGCSFNLEYIMSALSMFEHVVVPESLFKLKYQSLNAIPDGKLKILTIMRSKNHSFAKILRFRLEKLFPNACIKFKDMNDSLISCTNQFETVTDLSLLPDINKTLNRLESFRTQMVNLRQGDLIKLQNELDIKMRSLSNILSNESKKKEELMFLEFEISQMEGFKTNIEYGLKNVEHAIEIYENLIGSDEVILQIKKNLTNAKLSLTLSEREAFPVSLKKIENDFALIRKCIEAKGFSDKLLFKNEWSSDDVVEFYSNINEEDEEEEVLWEDLSEEDEFDEMEEWEFSDEE